jgi:hypothetical protein
MQIFSYLGKLASSGSLLSWDGSKIAPARSILHNPEKNETTIGGSLVVEKPIKLSNGAPYIAAGNNISITQNEDGSTRIDNTYSYSEKSNVIWKWNEKDTSQFNISCDSIGTGSLSVVNTPSGRAVRIDFKEKTEEGVFAFSFNDLDLQSDDLNRYRYVLQFRLTNFSGNTKDWVGMGATFLSNGKSEDEFYALGSICSFNSQNVRAVKIDAGNIFLGKYSPSGPRLQIISQYGKPNNLIEFQVNAITTRKSVGFQNNWKVTNPITTLQGGMGLDDSYYTSEFGSFKKEWGEQKLSSCGLILLSAPGTGQGHFDIDNIQILKHPMEW